MKKMFYTTLLLFIFLFPKNTFAQEEWLTDEEGTYYIIDNTKQTGLQEIEGKKYYIGEDGKQKTGFITVDDKIYFFSRTYGYALKGLVQNKIDGAWYQTEDGEVVIANGLYEIDGKEYYFEGRNIRSGLIEIDGKNYCFDSKTFEKRYSNVSTKYNELVLDHETGEYIRKQYHPVYYN